MAAHVHQTAVVAYHTRETPQKKNHTREFPQKKKNHTREARASAAQKPQNAISSEKSTRLLPFPITPASERQPW